MARKAVSGIEIDYELIGDAGAPAVALTPGGRFPKTTPGLRDLALALAAGGKRVLLWDRPNSGASDISFQGDNESVLHAQCLIDLIRALDLGPTTLAAGSAGSRVSLLAAAYGLDIVSHMVLWWISGGTVGQMFLGAYYYYDSAVAASHGGMEAVAALPQWAEQLASNPRNRDILLSQDPAAFIAKLQVWAGAMLPSSETPVSGMTRADFDRLTMPILILRNGPNDVSHPPYTSDQLHAALPHSELRDPPWSPDEWNKAIVGFTRGEVPGLFLSWPMLAPTILGFTGN